MAKAPKKQAAAQQETVATPVVAEVQAEQTVQPTKKQFTAMAHIDENKSVAVGVKAYSAKQAEGYARKKLKAQGYNLEDSHQIFVSQYTPEETYA